MASLSDIDTTPQETAKAYIDRLFRAIARARNHAQIVQTNLTSNTATGLELVRLYNILKELAENDSAQLSAAMAAGTPTTEQTEIITLAIEKVSGVSTGAELAAFMASVITNGETVNAAIESEAGASIITHVKSNTGVSARMVAQTYDGNAMPNLTAALVALLGS